MADLKAQVIQSANELKEAWTALQNPTPRILPRGSYEHWTRRSSLYRTLEGTAAIFAARGEAWNAVTRIVESPPESEDNLVTYGAGRMDYAVARHISLTAYIAVSWSAYDRLANVCGRLAGISDIAEHTKQNPKACEDFLGKKDTLGFAGQVHIQQAYSWPLKVTYKIRNWLVHEGYEEGGTPLFVGDRITDGLTLHQDAVEYLQKCCNYNEDNGKIDKCCLSAAEELWHTRDLLTILPRYHDEIDEMFAAFLKWSVESFVGQIRTFARRSRS